MRKVDERALKAGVDEILNRHPAVGFAAGVVRDGALESFHGHGVAEVASNTPITEDTVLRIGSITKTFTAVAVMRLWEQGSVDIDAPANKYLRAYQLVPASSSFRPATARHLLTHTAGIPETVHPLRALLPRYRETVKLGNPVPTLAEYYRGGIRLFAEPGTRFTYGNHGFATLGQLVEDVSGQPFADYLRENVLAPLGMADTDMVRSEVDQSRLAKGYRLRSHGPEAVIDREMVTAAAGGVYSTPRDMARYLAALLGGGSNEHGTMLHPATLAMMYEPQYQPDPRVPGIGLAFWRANAGGHRIVEHQGRMPGFHSQIFEFNPMSLRRQPNSTNPRLWLAGALGAAVGATAIVRRHRPGHG